MVKTWMLVLPALALAGCYPTDGWYYQEARERCLARGLQPGTAELDRCIAALERQAYDFRPSPTH